VNGVVSLELTADSGIAKCETEAGVETIQFDLPAVITCDKGLNEPRYAGLKGIMAAKKKPLEEVPCEAIPNQVKVRGVELPAAREAGRIVGTGVEAVPALIDALRNEAKVL
jgi:electron transfer flavoprotein beta subunit